MPASEAHGVSRVHPVADVSRPPTSPSRSDPRPGGVPVRRGRCPDPRFVWCGVAPLRNRRTSGSVGARSRLRPSGCEPASGDAGSDGCLDGSRLHSVCSRMATTGPGFTAVGSVGRSHAVRSRHRCRQPGDARLHAIERVHRSLRKPRAAGAARRHRRKAGDQGHPVGTAALAVRGHELGRRSGNVNGPAYDVYGYAFLARRPQW